MKKLVSIIIPSYNAEEWIGETINSCLNQTWKDIEIIIVDDGSTDNTFNIAKKFEKINVKAIRQNNNGGCSARNTGLRIAQGNYIQFLDADDLLDPLKIEKQIELLSLYDDQTISSSAYSFLYNDTKVTTLQKDKGWRDYDDPKIWLIESLNYEVMFPVQVWLTPREIINKTGYWNESIRYLVDNEYFSRAILNSKRIVFCKDAMSYYRKGHLSASHRKDLVGLQSRFKSKLLVVNNILGTDQTKIVRLACANHLHHFAFGIYPDYKQLVNEVEYEIKKLDVNYRKNLANGKMRILGFLIGWKNAKKIKFFLKQIEKNFTGFISII